MGSKLSISTKGDWDLTKLIKGAKALDGREVVVGPQGERNRNLAKIHEYGIQISVTPKMRAFLATQGLHLKQSTSFITIPERSFIRNGWDSNEQKILDKLEKNLVKLSNLDMSANEVLDDVGQDTAARIRMFANFLRNPHNHPFTIEQKGFDDPLIESGSMVRSIDYEKY